MLGQSDLDAGTDGSRAAFERGGQRAARVEDQQIARAKKFAQVIEACVLDTLARAVYHHQPHMIARQPASFGRLFGG